MPRRVIIASKIRTLVAFEGIEGEIVPSRARSDYGEYGPEAWRITRRTAEPLLRTRRFWSTSLKLDRGVEYTELFFSTSGAFDCQIV
ncbi:hypothetical protein PM082_018869 [Marasmius tenuissimus]|nr:hypothetical protein PM082_018869 [Marasmius tenuissimus]